MGDTSRKTIKPNKYKRYFSPDLTFLQAQGIFFILCDGLNETDLEELKAAYYPVSRMIIHKEMLEAERGYM